MNMEERFDQYMEKEFLHFERVENKRSKRPDLHAFLLLDELCPGDSDIVDGAEHDEIYLSPTEDDLGGITDDQIIELLRCGVRWNWDSDCLAMFV